jgi:hypothetical protein
MFHFDSMERRMAALFVLALGLIAWQAMRISPLLPPPLAFNWVGGEQTFPIAAPSWSRPLVLPLDPNGRLLFLREHSALWPGVAPNADCEVFLRTSASVWVRRGVGAEMLPGPSGRGEARLSFAAKDFLDDDDGDGDTLDSGELTRPQAGPHDSGGAEVIAYCPASPPEGGAP